MRDIAAQTIEKTRPWPLTSDARSQLIEEIARVREGLSSLTGQGLEEGIVRLPVAMTARRLETLNDVLDHAEIVDGIPCAAIGRRATLCEDGGEPVTYAIVFPGDGDPGNGCISADSPLGGAVLGAVAGDVIEVVAPAGRWSVTVTAID
jgi:transcription elongation GreA/GreB family factor